jgi:hypothetical protein
MKVTKGTPIDGVTVTTVTGPICVKNAKRLTFQFERAGHSSGNVTFSIQAALDYADGGDFIPYVNMISNDPNNHSQTKERQITVQLGANDTQFYALDLENFCYEYIQIKAEETGVGTNTAKYLMVS